KVKKALLMMLVPSITCFLLAFPLFFLFRTAFFSFIAIVLAIIIGLIIYISCVKAPYDSYKLDYKFKLIQKIVKFINPGLSYNPSGGIPQSKYMMSKIFTKVPDRYRAEDYVSGKLDKTFIEFSEIHSEYKTETRDKNGVKHEHWHTIFRGIFIIADFNKDFRGRTLVLPDIAEKFMGFLGQILQSWNLARDQLVKLEDPEFEKLFVVYSTDQIEARYILSTSLMRKLIEFNHKAKNIYNAKTYFSFVGSKLFVAISSSKNLFEPPIMKAVNEKKILIEYFSFMNLAASIVEDLDLNTRIWSKT
ncbi:MAG TPA: DUF3137 domain-containing protein, partial [Victivallales bacterium]|nr:DUF3137 domain-containing protein [Victivallales bacterium]